MTRKEWKEQVINFLDSVVNNFYIDKSKAQKLLNVDEELNKILESYQNKKHTEGLCFT